MENRLINDTCADCDPEVRRKILREEYEAKHAILMERYRQAKKDGDVNLMQDLETRIQNLVVVTRSRNFEISPVRGGMDVLWN
ncbi:uncharacterized protein F5Z01DRAFT_658684 [Emericellopsis atlantica]|uniref:Uncharacterized protein n=1 Tax=Emericellopsis atlantica TaxID=2614577 RepID=A0A9P7ZKI7_9HYPO|nr:uncharacterized protein F5Z01DRAFT_658684 [Emericellopsis atlantica]KAG9253386.1 hypothetical protein F5Z01DRAFT_658684 [Emericellopsis atlantica]